MIYVTLDGNVILNKNDLHKSLKEQLNLPNYYGNNLDALDEILEDYNVTINIVNSYLLETHLDSYYHQFLKVLHNNNVKMNIQ